VDNTSDVLGTGGVVSVTASAPGLPKLDSSYPKEDNEESLPKEDECYKYDEDCEQEFNPNNVNVYLLVVRDMGLKCSPNEFMHSAGVNRMDDAIPVANGNVMLNYLDDTSVKTANGCLYNFDLFTGASRFKPLKITLALLTMLIPTLTSLNVPITHRPLILLKNSLMQKDRSFLLQHQAKNTSLLQVKSPSMILRRSMQDHLPHCLYLPFAK